MGDRFDGALAGGGRSIMPEVGVADAIEQLVLNETLVTVDDSGEIITFRAVQNPYYGGVMVTQESGATNSDEMTEAIKLSQMTSMLNDRDRCAKYDQALCYALQKMPNSRAIDIGTGTGLLAMLAVRAGARHVDAIELFRPLADLASRVIAENEMHDGISVHTGASTEFSVFEEKTQSKDSILAQRADILVTEIFDSVLLGENCLQTISHAKKHLLKENHLVIPARAVVYGAVLQSEFCAKFHSLGAAFPFHYRAGSKECQGLGQGIPLHMEALGEGKDYEYLTEPFEVFSFNFESQSLESSFERSQSRCVPRIRNGKPNTIVTWWELDLTGNGDIIYSTKPGVGNWQDHWLTVFYPLLASETTFGNNEDIPLTMRHDQLSLSFIFGLDKDIIGTCTCGYHILPGGPYRIFELSDTHRLASLRSNIGSAMKKASSKAVQSQAEASQPLRCIDISDSGICALLASTTTGLKKAVEILSIEEDNELSALLYKQVAEDQAKNGCHEVYIEYKPLSSFVQGEILRKQKQSDYRGLDVVLSEPFTRAMSAYPLSTLCNLIIQRNALAELLSTDAVVVPGMAQVKAQAICFPKNTMQRSFGAVEEVEGLRHSNFAALYSDWPGEKRVSLPIFQYRASAASPTIVLHEYDLCKFDPEQITAETEVELEVNLTNGLDAVQMWVEYDGLEVSRVARSEVSLVSEELKRKITNGGQIVVQSGFDTTTGTFNVRFSATNS